VTQTVILQVGGRVLEITVTDVTCAYLDCSNQRRTDRARYCADHDSSAARMAAKRERQRS
jgi:hypothetical protein